MIKKILIFTCTIFISDNVCAKHIYKEKYYQEVNCAGAIEYRLADETRVDCLTNEYAIEYDFASKWAEAIGQSLHYARMTNHKAGIALIIESESDMRFYSRLLYTIQFHKLPITTWIIKGE